MNSKTQLQNIFKTLQNCRVLEGFNNPKICKMGSFFIKSRTNKNPLWNYANSRWFSSNSKFYREKKYFDICPGKKTQQQNLPPLTETSSFDASTDVKALMSGMIVLKKWLTPKDQVQILETIRGLGNREGGFYVPEFGRGRMRRRMHLKLMCLGKDWDPEFQNYGIIRRYDKAFPPRIPTHFQDLCEKAVSDALACCSPRRGFPTMSPDVCIVNFYEAAYGRLGMHQDKDESMESIKKGLPVVSFSLGDSAEFAYGRIRDVEGARVVDLESGDVLIFGGESRLVYHGVLQVKPLTAPKWLVDSTGLAPGRLNLTFRKM